MQSRLPTPVTQKSESNSQSKSEPRFKSSHHLILQRKPRSKKRVALIMAQHKLQQKPQQEMDDTTTADAVNIENLEDDESHTSAQAQPQIASVQNATTEKPAETLGKLEPDVLEPFETLESSASNEPHQPLLAYVNHSFVAVESQAISEVTANGISTSVIRVLNSLGGWLAGDVTSKDCNDTEDKSITTESLAVKDTLTPSQYDLAPSMVANFEIALARSSTPAARPFGNMSNLPPKLKEKVAPQQQHQQPLKPVLVNSNRGPSTHKYPLIAPPQHYPFMRNLNPSIPTIIKHHSEGSQKFVTDAFTLINSNQIQLHQQLRNVATPLEQKYSDKKSNIPRPDLIFPILPLPQPAQGLKMQPPKSPKPLEPISNGSQTRSRVATPIVSRTLNGSIKLPLTSSDVPHQTSIQHAETLPHRLYSLHQITKWDSEKDLPIIEYETEADLQTAAGSGKYFHNGEGTLSTAPPFAVQHATAVLHGSYAKEWRPLVDSNKKLKKSVLQPKPAGFLPSLEQSAQSNLVSTFKKSESYAYSVDDSKSDSLHLLQTFTHESTPAIPSKKHPLAPAPHLEVSNSYMPRSESNNENPPQSQKARRFHLPKLNPKSLLLEPVPTRTDPTFTSSTFSQEQQDQNHLAAAVIRGPYSSQLAVKNSTKTWKYSSPSSASPTLRPSSSFTQTTSVSKLSMLCASIAGTESRGLLGFDRENEHYLEKKKKAERLKTYAGHVRMLANLRASHHNRFGVMHAKDRGECGSNSGDSLLQVGADKTNMSRFGDFGRDKKDPALEKREKMISYARTIKKPTMSKAAGISMVGKESGGQYPKSLPPLECNDSGVDLDSMAAMHQRSMQVVESIKREMGLC